MMSNCPARAGFTGPRRPADAPRWDHPRSRGVYPYLEDDVVKYEGSSPLARGLRHSADGLRHGRRIIPARAGFTAHNRAHARLMRDHPRSRGVYRCPLALRPARWGSSPLARGLRVLGPAWSVGEGIIPARAGFTHPTVSDITPVCGSSPLARGLPSSLGVVSLRSRIIPARAGFTLKISHRGSLLWDHPRSRGVYRLRVAERRAAAGSSPLARGLRLRMRRRL